MDGSRHELTRNDGNNLTHTGWSLWTPAGCTVTPWSTRLVALALALGACSADRRSDESDSPRPPAADSSRGAIASEETVLSVEGALRQFRTGLEEPSGLTNAVTTRKELGRRFIAALAARDTGVLAALHITRAEFAWLYYPENPISQPPYSLPAGIAWFELQGNSEIGLRRALREYGGRRMDYDGLECPNAPVRYGRNRLWNKCIVRIRDENGSQRGLQLFATIVEREGKFKLASAANDL